MGSGDTGQTGQTSTGPARPAPSLNALAAGAQVAEFEILRVLGEGGFGIVYLAHDRTLGIDVAVKEYLPSALAYRQDQQTILPRSAQHKPTFDAGLRGFLQEARVMAQFDHPALVKVRRIWEANGTAYMAMAYYAGLTLRETIRATPDFVNEVRLKALLAPLLEAVELLHARQYYHRDIAPDNIIVQPNGAPVLLDFGAARHVIGDMTQTLTAVLKPGYAPIEQYAEDSGYIQGPWTDVYGFAATLYMAISGKPPPSAIGRALRDAMDPLAASARPGYDQRFLRGIDSGLAVLPDHRPRSIAAFREALGLVPDRESERTVIYAPQERHAHTVAPQPVVEPVSTSLLLPVPSADEPSTGEPRAHEPLADVPGARGTGEAGALPTGPAEFRSTRAPLTERRSGIPLLGVLGVAVVVAGAFALAYFQFDGGRGTDTVPREDLASSETKPSTVTTPVETPKAVPAPAPPVNIAAPKSAPEVVAPVAPPVSPLAAPSAAVPAPAGKPEVPAPASKVAEQPFRRDASPSKPEVPAPASKAAEQPAKRDAPPSVPQVSAPPTAKAERVAKAAQAASAPVAADMPELLNSPEPPEAAPVAPVAPPPPAAVRDANKGQAFGTATDALTAARQAAMAGGSTAQYRLGLMYGQGRGVERNLATAVEWFRKSAEQGYAPAQFSLGLHYENGWGVAKDDAQATKLYERAAEQGHPEAETMLGITYETGRGVYASGRGPGRGRNDIQAARWYRKGADHGNPVAQDKLGQMYEQGRGVFRDESEAFKLYTKSAEQGYAWGQFHLGQAYELGRGVAKNDALAIGWYRKAASQGNAEAGARLKALEGTSGK